MVVEQSVSGQGGKLARYRQFSRSRQSVEKNQLHQYEFRLRLRVYATPIRHNAKVNLEIAQPRLVPWTDPPRMNSGAPMPAIHSDESRLLCAYNVGRIVAAQDMVAVLRFEGMLQFRFGYPNDEALLGHPLAKFGLSYYSAYVVENSPLIAEIENQNRVHSRHQSGIYEDFRHWIITFHDETLEVVAMRGMFVGLTELPPSRAVCELGAGQ